MAISKDLLNGMICDVSVKQCLSKFIDDNKLFRIIITNGYETLSFFNTIRCNADKISFLGFNANGDGYSVSMDEYFEDESQEELSAIFNVLKNIIRSVETDGYGHNWPLAIIDDRYVSGTIDFYNANDIISGVKYDVIHLLIKILETGGENYEITDNIKFLKNESTGIISLENDGYFHLDVKEI